MDTGILQSLIDEDFGYKHEGKNWGRSLEHSSLVLNEESQKWYWNSENIGGDALSYLIKVRGHDKKTALKLLDVRSKISLGRDYVEEDEKQFATPYEKLVDLLWELGKGNREYWYSRKLSDKTIDRYRLGFYNGWNLIPLYQGDRFINFQCRRDKPKKAIKLWYREEHWHPILVNSEILNFVDTIYITEGTVDAILLTQEGIPAVSQTSGGVYWSPMWYPLFNNIKKIYYIADNDRVGINAARRVAESLGESRTFVYQFKDKENKYDTVDFFRDGGTSDEFKAIVERDAQNIFELGI